jgi:hypothetical protein
MKALLSLMQEADRDEAALEAGRVLATFKGPEPKPVEVALASLIPTQSTMPSKVAGMASASAESFPAIWVSRAQNGEQHKVFDGHHRLAAAAMRGDAIIAALIGTVRDGSFYPDPPPSEPTTEAEQEAARIVAAFKQNGRARA